MSKHDCFDITTHTEFQTFRTMNPETNDVEMPNSFQFTMNRNRILSERMLGVDNAQPIENPMERVSVFIDKCRTAGAHVRESETAFSIVFPSSARHSMGYCADEFYKHFAMRPSVEEPAITAASIYEMDEVIEDFDLIFLNGELMTIMDFIAHIRTDETYYINKSLVLGIDCTR